MASTKQLVNFPGVLHGQGHVATCTVYATKVTQPGTSESAYTDYNIKDVSKSLPEGGYELLAMGENFQVRLQNGIWLSR